MPARTRIIPGITFARGKHSTNSYQRSQGYDSLRSAKSMQSVINRLQIDFMQRSPSREACWETRQDTGGGCEKAKDGRDNLHFLFFPEDRQALWYPSDCTDSFGPFFKGALGREQRGGSEPVASRRGTRMLFSRLCTKGSVQPIRTRLRHRVHISSSSILGFSVGKERKCWPCLLAVLVRCFTGNQGIVAIGKQKRAEGRFFSKGRPCKLKSRVQSPGHCHLHPYTQHWGDRQADPRGQPASLASQVSSKTGRDPISKPEMDVSLGMTSEVTFQPQCASHMRRNTKAHTHGNKSKHTAFNTYF